LTYLELVLEQVFFVGHLAVKTEEFLLLRGHGLSKLETLLSTEVQRATAHVDVHLVLLVGVHVAG
jgi:hypothetical protein